MFRLHLAPTRAFNAVGDGHPLARLCWHARAISRDAIESIPWSSDNLSDFRDSARGKGRHVCLSPHQPDLPQGTELGSGPYQVKVSTRAT